MPSITAQRTFQMLENQTLWETATRINELLVERAIDHAIVGGVAVCLHGYRRNTVDLDLLSRPEDTAVFRSALEAKSSGVAVQLVLAGESEGPGQPAVFPDPGDRTT